MTLTRGASDLTAPHKAANSKSSKKKPYMWANTIWVTVTTPSKFSSPFKSKCVSYHFYTIITIFSFSDLVISAQKVEGPESFIIEIEKGKVDGLL